MASEQFSLCWDNFHKNMSSGMQSLLESEDLVDVTLAVEGRYLKAHKMVLSVCSPYFRELFQSNPCKHPIVFMKDVSYIALSDLLQFMYQGEVQVAQENLSTFIKTAEALQIKGLTGDGNGQNDVESDTPVVDKTESIRKPNVTTITKPVPLIRVKKPAGPASKRPRLTTLPTSESNTAIDPLGTTTPVKSIGKLEHVNVTATPEEMIQFKMEPSDGAEQANIQGGDDSQNDRYADDTLDDLQDDAEDYTLMDTGDDEPKAGTSAEVLGDGQDDGKEKSSSTAVPSSLMKKRLRTKFVKMVGRNATKKQPENDEFRIRNLKKQISDLNNLLKEKDKKINELEHKKRNLFNLNKELQKRVINYMQEFLQSRTSVAIKDETAIEIGSRINDKIHIGQNEWLSCPTYDSIYALSRTPQQFVKGVAVAVFGNMALSNSSVTGKSSNRTKGESRPALDAKKLRAIHDIYRHYLEKKGYTIGVIDLEVTKVGQILSRKIADLNRKRVSASQPNKQDLQEQQELHEQEEQGDQEKHTKELEGHEVREFFMYDDGNGDNSYDEDSDHDLEEES